MTGKLRRVITQLRSSNQVLRDLLFPFSLLAIMILVESVLRGSAMLGTFFVGQIISSHPDILLKENIQVGQTAPQEENYSSKLEENYYDSYNRVTISEDTISLMKIFSQMAEIIVKKAVIPI